MTREAFDFAEWGFRPRLRYQQAATSLLVLCTAPGCQHGYIDGDPERPCQHCDGTGFEPCEPCAEGDADHEC